MYIEKYVTCNIDNETIMQQFQNIKKTISKYKNS